MSEFTAKTIYFAKKNNDIIKELIKYLESNECIIIWVKERTFNLSLTTPPPHSLDQWGWGGGVFFSTKIIYLWQFCEVVGGHFYHFALK